MSKCGWAINWDFLKNYKYDILFTKAILPPIMFIYSKILSVKDMLNIKALKTYSKALKYTL